MSERLCPPVQLSRPLVIRVIIVVILRIPVSGRLRDPLPLALLLLLLLPLLRSTSTRTNADRWMSCTTLISPSAAAQEQLVPQFQPLLHALFHPAAATFCGGAMLMPAVTY